MDNPENIIYVILIIGSIVWSIAKKFIGKNAEKEQKPAPTSVPKRSLEDIFRELAGEMPPSPQPVAVKPISVPQPTAKPQPIMNDALALEKHAVRYHIPQAISQQRSFAVDLNDAADWQKAFVYSEIFNRKY